MRTLAIVLLCVACGGNSAPSQSSPEPSKPEAPAEPPQLVGLDTFFTLFSEESKQFDESIKTIDDRWRDGYAVMLLEIAQFLERSRAQALFALVRRKSGGTAETPDDLFRWIWKVKPDPHPQYARFKQFFYAQLDPRFAAYFDNHTDNAEIRLDEVRWGGVRRDGIPPLENPEMIAASAATYLADDNEIFGLEVNGDARAYPKRILAWHEMFKDTVGGVSVNGVYCTLCGSMILYKTEHRGTHYELGTSGFLYRSNKLMYDHDTESLWSTLEGTPVIGPLVGKGIELETLPVVTTTWGEWRKRHPKTTVLSLDTGHERDYSEGAAYREYFATDRLMFTVPTIDDRLKNKADVLALRFGDPKATPSAISADFLRTKPVYQGTHGGVAFVILTDASGANRVYEATGVEFKHFRDTTVIDTVGNTWTVSETGLTGPDNQVRKRLAAHRAFWFGWYSAHPETLLIK